MEENQNSFLVTPMSQGFALKAGETVTGKITVINPVDSTSDMKYKINVSPYSVIGENYDADLTSQTAQTEITKWITVKNPEGTIEFTINVPETAPGGGQYAALMIQSDPGENVDDAMVQSVFEITSIVYAEIDGETIHKGAITSNNVPSFSTNPNISVDTTLVNEGNTHEYATVKLDVTNVLDGESIYSYEDDDRLVSEVILPGTTRLLSKSINNVPSLGIISVNQTVEYMGETSVVAHHIIICPIWFMILVGVTLCTLIATIIKIVHHRSKKTGPSATPVATETQ